MKLPNANKAWIDWRKMTDYLLSEDHPIGKFKAKFFSELGFSAAVPEQLEAQLLAIAQNEPVAQIVPSPFGVKYIVDRRIQTPSGKEALIRTVWLIEHGDDRPRLVTAYPLHLTAKEGATMQELDVVVLERDIDEHGLKRGDIGTIVHCYSGGEAFEVEFMTVDGRTVAVVTLTAADIRPLQPNEILHARALTKAW